MDKSEDGLSVEIGNEFMRLVFQLFTFFCAVIILCGLLFFGDSDLYDAILQFLNSYDCRGINEIN
jgi:hypothetical protein